MTTKEVIEWFAEHHQELQYDEDDFITNLVREYSDNRIEVKPINIFFLNHCFGHGLNSLSIKKKKYKPYEKVETWMLGLDVVSKYNKHHYKIESIDRNNQIELSGIEDKFTLQQLLGCVENPDGTPFGEEVI